MRCDSYIKRYTLQHIKSEALIDEDSKKSIKPPYRFEMNFISIYKRYIGTYNVFALH